VHFSVFSFLQIRGRILRGVVLGEPVGLWLHFVRGRFRRTWWSVVAFGAWCFLACPGGLWLYFERGRSNVSCVPVAVGQTWFILCDSGGFALPL
jgi:hypothetical protein